METFLALARFGFGLEGPHGVGQVCESNTESSSPAYSTHCCFVFSLQA